MRFAQLLTKHTAYPKDMQVAYPCEMEKSESPRRSRRRRRLADLITSFGGAAQVARESGTPKSHISAMLAGKRGLGDELASKLETLYDKPEGWFDSAEANAAITMPSLDGEASGTVVRIEQRRPPTPDEVIDHLIGIVESLDETARDGLASALPCMVRKPGDLRAVAAVKAWLLTPAESAQRKQAKA